MTENTRPDRLIIETVMEACEGKATVDDVRAAIELTLAENDWTGYGQARLVNEHMLTCPSCLPTTIRKMTIGHHVSKLMGRPVEIVSCADCPGLIEAIAKADLTDFDLVDLEGLPTKGVQ